jgi:hypothetical protein
LDALLMIEEVLGVAAIDAAGEVEACINLVERDASSLYRVLARAVGNFSHPNEGHGERPPSFATFAVREGQIAFSGTRRRSLIVLTYPDIQVQGLKALLHEVLGDLDRAERQPFAPPTAPTMPLG